MTDIIRLSAADLAAKLASGEVSAVEATQAHLDRIAAVDGDVHAFLHVNDKATEVAADIDRRRAAGEQLHELAGVPIAVKDVLVTTDMPSTSGSKILEGYMSPYDATVVARARQAGLVAGDQQAQRVRGGARRRGAGGGGPVPGGGGRGGRLGGGGRGGAHDAPPSILA